MRWHSMQLTQGISEVLDFLLDSRMRNAVTVLTGVSAVIGGVNKVRTGYWRGKRKIRLHQIPKRAKDGPNWFYAHGDNASLLRDPDASSVEVRGSARILASNPFDRESRFVAAELVLNPPFPGLFDLKYRKFHSARVQAWVTEIDEALPVIPARGTREIVVNFTIELLLDTLWNREVPAFMTGRLQLRDNWGRSSSTRIRVFRAGTMVWR